MWWGTVPYPVLKKPYVLLLSLRTLPRPQKQAHASLVENESSHAAETSHPNWGHLRPARSQLQASRSQMQEWILLRCAKCSQIHRTSQPTHRFMVNNNACCLSHWIWNIYYRALVWPNRMDRHDIHTKLFIVPEHKWSFTSSLFLKMLFSLFRISVNSVHSY